jgi:small subunit ribosomal protein S15
MTPTDQTQFASAFRRHVNDNGSPEVQIAILTFQINHLQSHVTTNHKDFDCKRSLLKKVAKRRRLLKYLKEVDIERYSFVSKKLDLKV